MKLIDLKKGEKGIIKYIDANDALKQRLFSLGVINGAIVEMVFCSIGKSTIKIKVGNTLVALRDSEAKLIEVDKIENNKSVDLIAEDSI